MVPAAEAAALEVVKAERVFELAVVVLDGLMRVSVMLRAPTCGRSRKPKARSLRNTDKALVTPAHGPRETRIYKMITRVIG
jgi:hypothetical protein